MNKNVALPLGLLLVAALAGWQLLGGSDDADVPTGLTLEPDAPTAAAAESTTLTDAGVSTETEAAGAQREVVEAAPERAAAEAGDLVVRVVDEDDAPLPGVEVLVLVATESSVVERFRDLDEVDALMEREADVATSDEEGRLHLALSPEETSLLLLGRTTTRWGTLRLRHSRQDDPDLPPLVLRTDCTVHVRVVDEARRPVADYPVTLEEAREYWSEELAAARSHEDGVATFPHVQHILVSRRHDDEGRLVAQLGVLAPTPIRAEIEEVHLGGALLELVAPATGSVEVHVLTFEQQPFAEDVSTSLTQVPDGAPRVPSPFSNERRSSLRREAEDGVARYEHVALGMDLDAAASRPGCFVETHAYAPGPVRVGETVRLDVRFGEGHPILQLRLLDEDAAPFVRTDVTAEVRTYDGPLPGNNESYPSTDDEGFLRIDLSPVTEAEVRRSVKLELRGGETRPMAVVELPKTLRNGLNDLGEVTLGEAPLFVAGHVRTADGEPLRGALLTVEHRSDSDRSWRQKMRFNVRSEEDGSFEARGHEPDGAYRIAAQVGGHAAKWVEFTPGDRDVVLELTPQGTIAGRLLVDEGIDVQGLRLRVSGGPAGERLAYRQRMARIEEDGSFAFEGLHPGPGRTVHLQFDDVWADLQTFTGVAAVTEAGTQDPRLNPVDLRGQLHAHRIDVTGVGEEVALSGRVDYGPSGAEELEFSRWVHQREFVLLSSSPRIDLVSTFDGFRQVELASVGESATLELQPALKVTIVLTGDQPLPKPPLYLKPALAPADDPNFDADVGGAALDDGRSVLVNAPASGRHRVLWIAERRSSSSSIAGEVTLDREQYIDVVEGLEGQRFEVELTAEEMQKIVDRFD